jgi:hypothetical protein
MLRSRLCLYVGRLRLGSTQHQCGCTGRWVLTILRCSQIIIGHLLTRDGMGVVEGYYSRVRPQHGVCAELVWSIRVVWKGCGQERDVVWLGVRPAFVKLGMPEREVLQPEDLPHTVLFDVLILVYAALPPLYQPTWMRVLDAFMRAG